MKKTAVHLMLAVFFSGLVFVSSADEAQALSLKITANSSGLTLEYDLKRLGSDEFTLAPGAAQKEILLKGIAGELMQLWARVDSVDESQLVPVVNAVITWSFLDSPSQKEFPLSLPFGDYGIEAGLFKRTKREKQGAPIEFTLLCAPFKTNYDLSLNFGELFTAAYSGTSTLKNNMIRETIALAGDTMKQQRTLDLTILPVKTIPLTFFIYSGDVYDDSNTIVQSFSGMIPFPNGSYHVWIMPGFDMNDFFDFTAQACCIAEYQTCQDLPPMICNSAGGISQGEGTTCATVECN